MKFKIRRLTSKNLPQFHRLFNTILEEDFPEYQLRVSHIYRKHIFNKKHFKRFIKKRKNCILGAFENNALRGFLVIYGHTGGVVEFEWLGVTKSYRAKGVGTKLLQEGEAWALKHKFHYLFFHTENMQNVEFYKRRGYEYLGLRKKLYFGIDEHLMQKVLRNEPFEEIFEKYLKKG